MAHFVKLITQFIYNWFLIFLKLFNGFHMLACVLIHVHLVNLTYHKQVKVYKIKIYLLFATTPPRSTLSPGITTLKRCVLFFQVCIQTCLYVTDIQNQMFLMLFSHKNGITPWQCSATCFFHLICYIYIHVNINDCFVFYCKDFL